jgi:hypothetical protein
MTDVVYVRRMLMQRLRRELAWRDINLYGGVFCYNTPLGVKVLVSYSRMNIFERFDFPAGTPADEVVDSVILCLTFGACSGA